MTKPEERDTWRDEARMEDDGCPNFPCDQFVSDASGKQPESQVAARRAVLTLEKRLAIVLTTYAFLAVFVFPTAYFFVGIDDSPRPWTDSLYLSVTTITGTGYGDIQPCGFARCLACVEMLVNVPILAIGLTWAFLAPVTRKKMDSER